MSQVSRFARGQAGVSLISAIFLVVVLSGLAVATMSFIASQQTSIALDVLGVRAYHAARAGVEWGVYQQMQANSCAASQNLSFPATSNLSPFVVTVTCSHYTDAAAGATFTTRSGVASTLTNGSDNVTVSGVTSADIESGMAVWGNGITVGTTVLGISGSTVTLSRAATASGASTLTFYSVRDRWTVTATACNQGASCPNASPARDYVQRVVTVQF